MILREIASKTVQRVAELKKNRSFNGVMEEAGAMIVDTGFPFEKAMRRPGVSFICEVKKASPSKGLIDKDFPYLSIAKEYESAGASAISVLTEPFYFMGSAGYLVRIAETVKIPVLQKDFILDSYQIYEAKCLGASAILLICALLDTCALTEYIAIADGLGLSALVEAHTEEEVDSALKAGARIIGINNRNLKTFEVDMTASMRLRGLIPGNILFVSESGIKTAADIALLRENKTDGVLIGETLMRSPDKKRQMAVLRGD
ncbi:MAG: indole-3-glycerol phosphate synthase TrpC [Peptostreptococcaceae bacterium]|nr:indole-3-glycerol phosphate synthase TrpC [Peptostreptococcaceae bacterium]